MDGDSTRRFTSTDPPTRHALAVEDPRRFRPTPASTNTSPVPQDATLSARHHQSSSLSVQRSAQPTGQNVSMTGGAVTGQSALPLKPVTSDNDSIMSQFLTFFDAFVSLCMKQKEKEGLQASIARQLKAEERLKTVPHHPAYKDLAQSIREGGSENLKIIDAGIKTQEAICLDILPKAIESMKNALHVALPPLSNDAIAKLESDIVNKVETQLKAKIEAEEEAKEDRLAKKIEAQLRAKIEAEEDAREARLAKKLEVEYEKTHAKLLKEIEDSHAKSMKQLEARIRTSQLPSINLQESAGEMEMDPGIQKSNSMEWYKQKYRDHSPRLHELEVWKADELPTHLATLASKEDCQAVQAKAEVAIQSVGSLKSSLQSEVATVRSETTKVRSEVLGLRAVLEARSSALQSHEIAGLGKSLTSNIENLRFQHAQILQNQNHRITKLETNAATMSTNMNTFADRQKSPGDPSAQIAQTLRHDLSALTEKFLGLQEGVSSALGKHRNHIDARLQQNEVAIKHANDTAETLRVAIRSLETRYLNITTEDLFKHIVQAMKEMFPWMESQHQEIASLKEQLTSLTDQFLTKTAFSKDIDVLKDDLAVLKADVAQRIDSLKVDMGDASPQALNGLVKDVQEIWTKIEKLNAAQTGQTVDIVKRVQEHAALCNQFETQSDTVQELAEKVSDLAEVFERYNHLETTYERIKKDVTELQRRTENSQGGLPGLKGFCSPETVNMICENLITRHDKATTKPRFDQLIEVISDLGQQWAVLKTQEFANRRLHEESHRPHTSGSRSEPEHENGTAVSPRLLKSSRDSLGVSREPATPQVPNIGSFEAHAEPRSVSKTSTPTTTGPSETSMQSLGKAPQKESDSCSRPSQDDALGSRVAPSPLAVDVARWSPPPKGLSGAEAIPQSILQKSEQSSRKRPRDLPSFTGCLNGNSSGTASPGMSEASPAPSSCSGPSRKKKRKKEKQPSKRKEGARPE
ncbi:paramyosin [Penicillium maclennaniae]|uniref:paramyosin n=1 Tax=Penicillium maclennaniae TaxID=1343394 RepID=UPI00254066B9|nr:paramyosin [Penicillium maclennaniae]KAJ5670749.1 paramyosin [Penicillium maclennaniae]